MTKFNHANAATRQSRMFGRLELAMDKAEGKIPKKPKPAKILNVLPCSCGSRKLNVEAGTGPHKFKLVCECGKFQRWMKSENSKSRNSLLLPQVPQSGVSLSGTQH